MTFGRRNDYGLWRSLALHHGSLDVRTASAPQVEDAMARGKLLRRGVVCTFLARSLLGVDWWRRRSRINIGARAKGASR